MNKLLNHLKTVFLHRKQVRKICVKMGLYWQGLVHDFSKYSLKELMIYKYYTGTKSPHQVCRDIIGYSPFWINHYHRNKHHYQFWLDDAEDGKLIPIKMPYKYVVESFCDMVGASKTYNKNNFIEQLVWIYWISKCKNKRIMHEHSVYLLEKLLWNYKELGEKDFFIWYKNNKSWLKHSYNGVNIGY